MPKRDDAKRAAFASAYAEIGNATRAAILAGVPQSSAHSMGYRWLRDPMVIELIRDAMNERLKALGPVALDVIKDVLLSEKASPQTRLQAARDVLDRLGWVPPKRSEALPPPKPEIEEMSLLELEEYVSGVAGVRLDESSLRSLSLSGGDTKLSA